MSRDSHVTDLFVTPPRELEEDERASTMLDERFGLGRRDSTGSASSSSSSPGVCVCVHAQHGG